MNFGKAYAGAYRHESTDWESAVTQHLGHSLRAHTRKECIISFFVNFAIAIGLGYWTFSQRESVEPWGVEGYGLDLLATGFFLSAIVAAIVIVKHKKAHFRWSLPVPTTLLERCADLLPLGVVKASVVIGLLGLVFAGVMLLALLTISPHVQYSALSFALIKGVWAGVLAMMVVTMGVRCGLKLKPV